MKQNPEELAASVITRAMNFFRATKNFGAITTVNRKQDLKAKLEWIATYCDKKTINKEQFMPKFH